MQDIQKGATHRRRRRWVVNVAVGMIAALALAADAGDWVRCKGPPYCPKKRITNIHYACDPAGIHCDTRTDCSCKDVMGKSGVVAWSNCYCLRWSKKAKKGGGCGSGGREFVVLSNPVNRNTVVHGRFEPDRSSTIEVFCLADIAENGQVLESQELLGPDHIQGDFEIFVEDGPPEAIPTRFMSLDVMVESVMFMGLPTGPNHLMLAPGGDAVVGYYNEMEEWIKFDEGVPVDVYNDIWPDGRRMEIMPGMTLTGFLQLDLMPASIMWIPIRIYGPHPGLPSEMNFIDLEGALANTPVFCGYGFKSGLTNVPGCPGVQLELAKAKLLDKAVSDEHGYAQFEFFAPKAASGRTVLFQAVEIYDCEPSDVIEYTFP